MTSLHVICGLSLPNQKFWLRLKIGDCLKNFFEDLFFFFWRTLAAVFLVLGLGLEHSCPWPREGLSSERLSLASDFFCVLGLGLEPCVLDSTSGNYHHYCDGTIQSVLLKKQTSAFQLRSTENHDCLSSKCLANSGIAVID